jgi:hypothetical protein
MISIISVYSDKEILEGWLLGGLKRQTVDYELILVDNTENKFKSAAAAFNYGASLSAGKSKYLLFAHQDIKFTISDWLESAEKLLNSIANLGIAGVAGARRADGGRRMEIASNIEHGVPPREMKNRVFVEKPEKVMTIDECLTIVPRRVFNVLKFDEKTCDDWHFYAVDYCLASKELGFDSYVLPLVAHHRSVGGATSRLKIILSLGGLPKEYYRTMGKISIKYKNLYAKIYTTCGIWDTKRPVFLQRITSLVGRGRGLLARKIKFAIKK